MVSYMGSPNQTRIIIDDGTTAAAQFEGLTVQTHYPITYHDRFALSNLVTEMREEPKVKSPAQMKRKLPTKEGYKARKEYWR